MRVVGYRGDALRLVLLDADGPGLTGSDGHPLQADGLATLFGLLPLGGVLLDTA